jgi:hypothetical protein
LYSISFGEFIAELKRVVANRVTINLETKLIQEKPFTGVIRLLCRMKQTEVDDWFRIVEVFTEPFRDIGLEAVATPATAEQLHLNRDRLEAVVSNESRERAWVVRIAVFLYVFITASSAGTRVSDPHPVKLPELSVNTVDEQSRDKRMKTLLQNLICERIGHLRNERRPCNISVLQEPSARPSSVRGIFITIALTARGRTNGSGAT